MKAYIFLNHHNDVEIILLKGIITNKDDGINELKINKPILL